MLRTFIRYVPAEQQRVFVLTILLGVICGFVAVMFHLAISWAEHLLIGRALAAPGTAWIPWVIITPALGGLICGVALYYIVPDARGSGIPQVKAAYVLRGGRIAFRDAVGKFVLGVVQIGSGASLGREGPTVQICAGIASQLGRLAALPRRQLRGMLPVGTAAGIAAAFNAPIAAVTFTVEEIIGDLDQTVLAGVVVAAAIAAAIEHAILGEHPVFTIPGGYGLHHYSSLLFYAVLGVVAALVSVVFTDTLLWLRKQFQQMSGVPVWARPAIGGFVTGVLLVVALLWLGVGGINGGGYATLSAALAGSLAPRVMLALCLLKIAATLFSYSSGGAGGLFAPTLFIGGMLGGAVGYVDAYAFGHPLDEIGAFALVGMGAVFAGVIRAPITSVLIIFEMTGGYELILPLMIANMAAYAIARRVRPHSVYEALLAQDGIYLHHPGEQPQQALARLRVADAMTPGVVSIDADLTVEQALERLATAPFSSVAAVDGRGRFVGLVSQARLRRTIAEGSEGQLVRTIADRRTPLYPDEFLTRALMLMDREEARQLAVVDRVERGRLVGILSMSDIVRAQARAIRAETPDQPAEPVFSEVEQLLNRQDGARRRAREEHDDDLTLHTYTVELDATSPAVDRPVATLNLPTGVLLITITRGRQTLVPKGATVLAPGDQVAFLASERQLRDVLFELTGTGDLKQVALTRTERAGAPG